MSTDHTAIQVQMDPFSHRIKGVAVHGDTPFEMPLITKITNDLYVGGCVDGFLLPTEIVHVVSLYPWERYRFHSDVRSRLEVWVYDAGVPDRYVLDRIVRWTNSCREDGATLVHCQVGLNRSGLIAALALISDGSSSREAIALLREKRSPAVLCNRGFEEYVLSLDRAKRYAKEAA